MPSARIAFSNADEAGDDQADQNREGKMQRVVREDCAVVRLDWKHEHGWITQAAKQGPSQEVYSVERAA